MTILYMSVPLVKKGVNLLTNNKRVYTVEEIQAILGVSKNTTYALVKSGVFHSVCRFSHKLKKLFALNKKF